MNIPPLCIIQARMGSMRLPGKMLLKLGDETLIARAVRIAGEAFGGQNVLVAIPHNEAQADLLAELERIEAHVMQVDCDEKDVLGRFHAAAHSMRWHPDSPIIRYTPDDPWKDEGALRAVASGLRVPVEFGGEAFTLAQLDYAHVNITDAQKREHITHALFDYSAPVVAVAFQFEQNLLPLSIDTPEDYAAACARIAEGAA
jgi:spore coat polysaccharide biosynthesis protein SpsF